jgi:transposase-like protein
MGRDDRPKEDIVGETTPRKQYRKFTAQQKTELVLASLRGQKTFAEICRENDIADGLRASGVTSSSPPARRVCPAPRRIAVAQSSDARIRCMRTAVVAIAGPNSS